MYYFSHWFSFLYSLKTYFPLNSFKVLFFMLRSLIHLEFTFCVWYGIEVCFYLFTETQFSYYHLSDEWGHTCHIPRSHHTWALCLWALHSVSFVCLLIPIHIHHLSYARYIRHMLPWLLVFILLFQNWVWSVITIHLLYGFKKCLSKGPQKQIHCQGHIKLIHQFGQNCHLLITGLPFHKHNLFSFFICPLNAYI